MRCTRPITLSLLLALWAFFSAASAACQPAEAGLQDLIHQGGYILTAGGAAIAEFNPDVGFVPASTIKLATALTALKLLGPSYRLKTEFFLRNGRTLCIKGYGDPYLISEYLADIAASLKERGLTKLDSIILDDSFFELEHELDGAANSTNPYDAVNGALAVNFNTLPLIKYDTGVMASPEPQTPVLPITRDIGSLLDPGLHRVNVSAFTNRNRTITPRRYAAELVAELLRRQNIAVGPAFSVDRVNNGDKHLYTYLSRKTVAEMVEGCLKYSNNFIANQLFLYCGAKRFGPPATWAKARAAVSEILETEAGLPSEVFTIVEGSGLSRKNRITPAAMIRLLEAFKPYAALLREKDGVLLKSGTMAGVYGYAGYFEADRLDPFVLLLNQEKNSRDRLLAALAAIYRQRTGLQD